MYLSAHKATKKLGISSDTLRRWLKQGRITAKTSPSGTRLYDISSIFPELTSQDANYTVTTTTATTTTKNGSSMHGSLVSSKKRILKGRNNSSASDTQPTNSSAILDQGQLQMTGS
jgi:hypothetical protein